MTATPAAIGPAAQRPALAAGLDLLGAMRGSGYRSAPGLVRRRDGQTLQLTPLLYAVLAAVDGRRDHRELAEAASAAVGRPLTAADAAFLVEEKLRPLGVLRRPDGTDPETRRASPLLALRCKYEVTDPDVTARVTRPFAALFRPWVVATVVAAFVAIVVEVLFRRGLAGAIDEAFHDPRALLLVVGLTILSTGFHEFGHAAACRYGGATPGAMGAGIYLVWPVFYTEVTDSYRLGRAGRLRVDLGGLYFNAVFAVAVFGVWALTAVDALLLLIATQVLQMARQLLPLVRFDGYHILADLTGVPDLFAHIKPTLAGLLPTRWGDPATTVLRPWARAVVTLWVVVVVPVLAVTLGALVLLLPRLVATAWDGVATYRAAVAENLAAGELAAAAVGVLAILTLALPVLSIAYLLARVVRRTARRVWQAAGDHPARRLGVLTAAAFATAAVAAAWWPQGQYEPVAPTERGTVQDLLSVEVRAADAREVEPVLREAVPLADAPPMLAPTSVVRDEVTPAAGKPEPSAAIPRPAAPAPELVVSRAAVERPAWPFAWDPPADALPGDNRAWAVNTVDGAGVSDVTIDSGWIRDGAPVTQRNEAWALAQCLDCSTVAVAYQALFIVGGSDEVVPVNSSVAVNELCERCTTSAVAEQLVLTLVELPGPGVRGRIAAVLAGLEGLRGTAPRMTPAEIEAVLQGASARIVTILADADLLVTPGAEPSPADAEDGTDASVDDEETAVEPTSEPTSEATPDPADAGTTAETSDGTTGGTDVIPTAAHPTDEGATDGTVSSTEESTVEASADVDDALLEQTSGTTVEGSADPTVEETVDPTGESTSTTTGEPAAAEDGATGTADATTGADGTTA